jgi:simple sugar transport system ATP-binding protein
MTSIVKAINVGKSYGTVLAISGISAEIVAGEVLCILGDNGAGKSTLIKILSGVHTPSEGTLEVYGEERTFESPRDALDAGIATVYQDLAVVPLMPVWRNFFLGSELRRGWGVFRRLDVAAMRTIAKQQLEEMGISLRSVEQPIGTLSGGERQAVAIARAVYFGAKAIILDEPTSALGVKQASVVLKYIAKARDQGLGVVFITHNPNHAYPVGDRFLLLKLGRSIGYFEKRELTIEKMTQLMAGSDELSELADQLERKPQSRPQKPKS